MAIKKTGRPKGSVNKKKKDAIKKPAGRPRIEPRINGELTDIFINIINDISSKTISTVQICKDHGISTNTFYTWLRQDITLKEIYNDAKLTQIQAMAEEIIDISDNKELGDINQRRLMIDTRKWLLSKLDSAKYGDKQVVEQELTIKKEQPLFNISLDEIKDNKPDNV